MALTDQMKAVEDRAFDARLTMAELLGKAGVAHSTWSRAKSRGTIRTKTLRRVEDALALHEKKKDAIEREIS